MASAWLASKASEQFLTVVRNGYHYQIDLRERTRRVFVILTITGASVRSRTWQRQAGGAERRASDDDGHYSAARFNRPSEAFNHFAQNANFKRGGYRVLEDEWAREKHAGRAVTVRIVPRFTSVSVRPSMINVWWTVDDKKALDFPTKDRRSMATDDSEHLLKEIGQLLMTDSEYRLEPTLLYDQFDHNMIGESIFQELDNQFLYRWPVNKRLSYVLIELWESQQGDDRWAEVEYVLRDGLLDVAYICPVKINPEKDILERRECSLL